MNKKVATYLLFIIFFISFVVDVGFMLRALFEAGRLSPSEATVDNVVVDKYRATTKIPTLDITSTENKPEKIYQKFGSYSLRWLFQSIPEKHDKISYYKLDQTDKERGNYAVGICPNQRCSGFKLWLDVYASYTYSLTQVLSIIVIFAAVIGLYNFWDASLLYEPMNKFLLIYPAVKILSYLLAA